MNQEKKQEVQRIIKYITELDGVVLEEKHYNRIEEESAKRLLNKTEHLKTLIYELISEK